MTDLVVQDSMQVGCLNYSWSLLVFQPLISITFVKSCSNDRKAERPRNELKSSMNDETCGAYLCAGKRDRRRPLSPLASRSRLYKSSFGSGKVSTLRMGGSLRSSLPFGFPAARRIAASSQSNHASCILIGTTRTTATSLWSI